MAGSVVMKRAMLSSTLLLIASFLLLSRHLVETKTPQADTLLQPIHRFQKQSREQRRISDQWIANNHNLAVPPPCPCENPQGCHRRRRRPTSITPKHEQLVFGFADMRSTGVLYNWTHIDTVAWTVSEELLCRAHEHGARAVVAAPSFSLTSEFNITSWVQTSLHMVQGRHADGIVFDCELPLTRDEARMYVSLISATRDVFSHSNLQVTTCVAWSPDGIDGRNYPYADLANASDFLYVMDYDTQSQISQGPCIASANAPYFGMIRGIERYLQLGIDAQKLLLGVPWYGYRYPCLGGTTTVESRFCPIAQVPFRGVNCSDAAGTEVPYGTILRTYRATKQPNNKSNICMKRDEYMDAAYFNTVDSNDGTVYQYFFDDPTSMRHKFSWAKSMRLGGVGPYTFDDLDPVESPEESEAMWSAFDVVRSTDPHANNVLREHVEMENVVYFSRS